MEEQRVTYGPDLYQCTDLGIAIRDACFAWANNVTRVHGSQLEQQVG